MLIVNIAIIINSDLNLVTTFNQACNEKRSRLANLSLFNYVLVWKQICKQIFLNKALINKTNKLAVHPNL